MMCGGLHEVRIADDEVKAIIEKVKEAVAKKIALPEYKAHSYCTQVVAGTNYFVKVKVGHDEFIHLRIFVPLPCNGSEPELIGAQLGKSESDPITHFEA